MMVFSLSPKTAQEDKEIKQIRKYKVAKRSKGEIEASSTKRERPEIHASHALGFNHCKRKPSENLGCFAFCEDRSGVDVAIL